MQLRRWLQAGAVFAERLNDLSILRTRHTVYGDPVIVRTARGDAMQLSGDPQCGIMLSGVNGSIKSLCFFCWPSSDISVDGVLDTFEWVDPTVMVDGVETTTVPRDQWSLVSVSSATAKSGNEAVLASNNLGDDTILITEFIGLPHEITAAECLNILRGRAF